MISLLAVFVNLEKLGAIWLKHMVFGDNSINVLIFFTK